MTLILSGDITLRRTWQPMDPDAVAYITAVETADGQALEEKVKIAIDNFVLGCKADGIWDAIKASCILAGARTLDGALVPLTGTAPTNYNFVAGDYDRKTGLVGDGSTKYLDSNRANNADPQNSHHLAAYCSVVPTIASFPNVMSSTLYGTTGATQLYLRKPVNQWEAQSRNATGQATTNLSSTSPTFVGVSRNTSSNATIRANGISRDNSIVSQVPGSESTLVFAFKSGNSNSDARLAFYSIGEALDLALLDARVTDLINKFAEVIP